MESFPTYNSEAQSWANIEFTVQAYDGPAIEDIDIKDLSGGPKVDVGEQRKPGGTLVATTAGSQSCEGKGTFYVSGVKKMHKGLVQVARAKNFLRSGMPRIALVRFDVLYQHTPLDAEAGEIGKIMWKGCRILSDMRSMSEGNDADTVEIDLHPMDIWIWVDGAWAVLL
jgi:hypothetical protein